MTTPSPLNRRAQVSEASRELAAELEPKRDGLEARLREYLTNTNWITALEKANKPLHDLFKVWLEGHDGEQLIDGEHNVVGFLQERDKAGRECDLFNLYEKDRVLFEQLLRNGVLKVDEAAIKRAGSLVGGIEKWLMPKGRTTALIVREIK